MRLLTLRNSERRDSTGQLTPYVQFATQDENLKSMLGGAILRQSKSVLIDNYANAFNYDNNSAGHQDDIRSFLIGIIANKHN